MKGLRMRFPNPLQQQRMRIRHAMTWQADVLLDILRIHGPLTVMQLINKGILEKVGSPATLHKAVNLLRQSWLVSEEEMEDGRKVTLHLTTYGEDYLKGTL